MTPQKVSPRQIEQIFVRNYLKKTVRSNFLGTINDKSYPLINNFFNAIFFESSSSNLTRVHTIIFQ